MGDENGVWRGSGAYSFWIMTSGSFSRSLMSMFLPLLMTSGCFLLISQPMWEKKNPRLELWGSASVSLYLWCCRWSRTHMYKQFCNAIFQTIDALGCRQTIKKHHVVESNTNCFDKTRIHNGKRFRLVKLLCHRDNTEKKRNLRYYLRYRMLM